MAGVFDAIAISSQIRFVGCKGNNTDVPTESFCTRASLVDQMSSDGAREGGEKRPKGVVIESCSDQRGSVMSF